MVKALVLFIFKISSVFALQYDYQPLTVMEYDEVRQTLQNYVQKSRKQAELDDERKIGALGELKNGLRFLLMRSDRDYIRNSLVVILQVEIQKYRPFLSVLGEVVQGSIKGLNSKKSSVRARASHLFIIENAMGYIKTLPESPEANSILSSIARSRIRVPQAVTGDRRLNASKGEFQPSKVAHSILKQRRTRHSRRSRIEKKSSHRTKESSQKPQRDSWFRSLFK